MTTDSAIRNENEIKDAFTGVFVTLIFACYIGITYGFSLDRLPGDINGE